MSRLKRKSAILETGRRRLDPDTHPRAVLRRARPRPPRMGLDRLPEQARARDRRVADIEQLVLLFVEQISTGGTGSVPPELVGSLRDRILGRVEDRLVVRRPHD